MFAGSHNKQSPLPAMIITQQTWLIFFPYILSKDAKSCSLLILRRAYLYPRIVWLLSNGKQTGERDNDKENDTLICLKPLFLHTAADTYIWFRRVWSNVSEPYLALFNI